MEYLVSAFATMLAMFPVFLLVALLAVGGDSSGGHSEKKQPSEDHGERKQPCNRIIKLGFLEIENDMQWIIDKSLWGFLGGLVFFCFSVWCMVVAVSNVGFWAENSSLAVALYPMINPVAISFAGSTATLVVFSRLNPLLLVLALFLVAPVAGVTSSTIAHEYSHYVNQLSDSVRFHAAGYIASFALMGTILIHKKKRQFAEFFL